LHIICGWLTWRESGERIAVGPVRRMGESKWGLAAKRDFYRLSAPRASATTALDAVFPTFSNVRRYEPSTPLGAELGGSLHEFDCRTEIPT
jgi:hypothetical protein